MAQLVVALVQREQRPEGEQHDRDQEGGEVADPACPNGCLRSGSRRATREPSSSIAWLPESATEWKASASIEDAPVIRNPMNLAAAMPRLARRAAMTAMVLCSRSGLAAGVRSSVIPGPFGAARRAATSARWSGAW
jgi:hypothetical protein